MGRLTADPEIGSTPKGTKFAKFSIATEDQIKTKNGWEKETVFHNVTLWNRSAEYAEKHLHKGEGIIVEGKQKNDKYESESGTKSYSHIVVATFKKQFLANGSVAATDEVQKVEDNENQD